MRRVIADALAAGYLLSVYDGEETTVRFSQDAEQIFGALRSTDEDRLNFYERVGGPSVGAVKYIGHVYFVYGNTGYDVVCDSSVSLEAVLKGASALARELERRA